MKVLIVANGEIRDTKLIKEHLKSGDIVICCDGGTRYLFWEGILPDYIIGDLDSSQSHIIDFYRSKGVVFKEYDTKKDQTDLELAINFAISLEISEIIIFGAIGSRIDHTITNVNLLVKAVNSNVKAIIKDENNEIILINNYGEIRGEEGDIVSLIPLSTEVNGISTKGLEYCLNNASMYIGNSLGVSNVMVSEVAEIFVKEGYLIVMKSRD